MLQLFARRSGSIYSAETKAIYKGNFINIGTPKLWEYTTGCIFTLL